MRTLKLSVLALSLAMVPGVAFAGNDSGPRTGGMGHMPRPHVGMGHMPRPNHGMGHMPRPSRPIVHNGGHRNWGAHQGGRWTGGHRAPGGWNGYRRPFRGYALPSYWVQPSFYVPNYSYYGFAQPSSGYGWSRYYNDAVLTDRYGRVYDSVYDVDWDRGSVAYGEDYSDSYGYADRDYGDDRGYRDDRRRGRSGIGGAIAGGAIGAIAGSAIAGRGDRLPGALIGGGLGAIAGAAIDQSSDGRRVRNSRRSRDRVVYEDRDLIRDDSVTYGNGGRYDGRWTGTWEGSYENQDGRVYQGTYEGTYDTGGRIDGGPRPHWDNGGGDVRRAAPAPRLAYPGYGYGYYEPQVTTITINSAPVTTTTTTTYVEEEVVYAKAARKRVAYKAPRKVWKPKPRCVCKVVYR